MQPLGGILRYVMEDFSAQNSSAFAIGGTRERITNRTRKLLRLLSSKLCAEHGQQQSFIAYDTTQARREAG
jgi:hypothetical protein